MPWTAEDNVNIAEAPYVASSASVSGVRGWLVERAENPDGFGARHETRTFTFQCKPGALGTLQTEELITVNGVQYRYAGLAPHGPSIFDHLLLMREVG